ncbi:MAG TPA: PspC domain-containing protein [Caldisericia bacterium]|nr:MAG: DNA-binding transcriptional activator PspC [bacterium ADurb.Bin132]HNW31716.1 PspC domain-containing protein [Caldisericia bacterium]HNY61801.1 PspC domain-containing protein [Caldisericia bacterium]HOC79371.1 PspC domain-containing protein [Caldisericia bacterium]HOG70820.1 PspC domain-containing protein [Caldisericia bacterium]
MKKLYRSRKERVIGGVCGGIGVYFGIDPTLTRIIWVAATLLGGAGIIAYIVAWIVIPEEPEIEGAEVASTEIKNYKPNTIKLELIIGGSILAIGIMLLLSNFGLFEWGWIHRIFWPALIIFVGILIISAVSKKK